MDKRNLKVYRDEEGNNILKLGDFTFKNISYVLESPTVEHDVAYLNIKIPVCVEKIDVSGETLNCIVKF